MQDIDVYLDGQMLVVEHAQEVDRVEINLDENLGRIHQASGAPDKSILVKVYPETLQMSAEFMDALRQEHPTARRLPEFHLGYDSLLINTWMKDRPAVSYQIDFGLKVYGQLVSRDTVVTKHGELVYKDLEGVEHQLKLARYIPPRTPGEHTSVLVFTAGTHEITCTTDGDTVDCRRGPVFVQIKNAAKDVVNRMLYKLRSNSTRLGYLAVLEDGDRFIYPENRGLKFGLYTQTKPQKDYRPLVCHTNYFRAVQDAFYKARRCKARPAVLRVVYQPSNKTKTTIMDGETPRGKIYRDNLTHGQQFVDSVTPIGVVYTQGPWPRWDDDDGGGR